MPTTPSSRAPDSPGSGRNAGGGRAQEIVDVLEQMGTVSVASWRRPSTGPPTLYYLRAPRRRVWSPRRLPARRGREGIPHRQPLLQLGAPGAQRRQSPRGLRHRRLDDASTNRDFRRSFRRAVWSCRAPGGLWALRKSDGCRRGGSRAESRIRGTADDLAAPHRRGRLAVTVILTPIDHATTAHTAGARRSARRKRHEDDRSDEASRWASPSGGRGPGGPALAGRRGTSGSRRRWNNQLRRLGLSPTSRASLPP
jgi:hypothetical protein